MSYQILRIVGTRFLIGASEIHHTAFNLVAKTVVTTPGIE